MGKDTLKKMLGILMVISMTFILPALVTTITSPGTLDNRSQAALETGSKEVTIQSSTSNTNNNILAKIYPIALGIIVFLWLVTILVYLGYRRKKHQ